MSTPRAPEPRAAAEPRTVAWIGLGRMGEPMAARLVAAGHDVRGHGARAEARARWAERAGLPAAATARLPSSDAVAEVLDAGLLPALPAGALLVDMGSSDPVRTRELALNTCSRPRACSRASRRCGWPSASASTPRPWSPP